MKTPLIQRAKFNNRENHSGLYSIIELDYMGAGEYYFRNRVESLGRIETNPSYYTFTDVTINEKVITVYCKYSQKDDIMTYLTELSENKLRLDVYPDFDSYMKQTVPRNRTDFWWDIENDFMFWKKNLDFELKFKRIIIWQNETL